MTTLAQTNSKLQPMFFAVEVPEAWKALAKFTMEKDGVLTYHLCYPVIGGIEALIFDQYAISTN